MSVSYPTIEQFKQELWDLTKKGDPNTEYHFTLALMQQQEYIQEYDFDNTPVSYKLLKNKYIQYYNAWVAKYGSRDPKYISNKDEVASIGEFISQKRYMEIFTNSNPKAFYLFGDIDFDELEKSIQQFASTIGKNISLKQGSGDSNAKRADQHPTDTRSDNPVSKPKNVI